MQHLRIKILVLAGLLFSCVRVAVAGYLSGYEYTTIDSPSSERGPSVGLFLRGINDSGQMVGEYFTNLATFGILYSGGILSTVDVPFPGASQIMFNGINNSGQIVGNFADATGQHGFLDTAGTFTLIDYPAHGPFGDFTAATGINNTGQVVGYYSSDGVHGFLYSGGEFTTIDFPGAYRTFPYGLNDRGEIVGYFQDVINGVAGGFLRTGDGFTVIAVPGVFGAAPSGINNTDQIVGNCACGLYDRGFLLTNGSFATFDSPEDIVHVGGINSSGQIVGTYQDRAGSRYGFLATPTPAEVPEPGTLSLLTGCLIAFSLARSKPK